MADVIHARELADFNPSTGHLHDCVTGYLTGGYFEGSTTCALGCAGHLYAIAQDAEQALAQVRAALAEWDLAATDRELPDA